MVTKIKKGYTAMSVLMPCFFATFSALAPLLAQTEQKTGKGSQEIQPNLFPYTRIVPISKIPPINGRKGRSPSILTISIPQPTNPHDLLIEPPIPRPEPSQSVLEYFPFEPSKNPVVLPIPATATKQTPATAPTLHPLVKPPRPNPDYQIKLSNNELKARSRFLRWIGGKEALAKKESNMSDARAAAAAALNRHDVDIAKVSHIAIIDLTKPSYLRRMMLFDPKTEHSTRHLVAHGVNSGKTYAKSFSNRLGSNKTSAGLYWVGDQYRGKHGLSLRLHGMDKGINDSAYRRAIVLHAAWYVSYASMSSNLTKEEIPRLGRSKGCPSVHQSDLNYVLTKLKTGTFLYIYVGKD